MEGTVYLLCAGTALACAVLLLRGYARQQPRLLLWCGLFFLSMAVENAILFLDVVVVPGTDLLAVRRTTALAGQAVLLYGLIWETR